MVDVINQLKDEVRRIEHMNSESNVRANVIRGVFLKECGYDVKNSIEEESLVNGFCDLYVPINEKIGLPIEIKNGKQSLKVTDVEQLKRYASVKGQRFGLLTNGYEYLLADFTITPNPTIRGHSLYSYIVFWFNIFKDKGNGWSELKYFNFLTCKHLYEDKRAYFYSDIAQYREWKFDQGLKRISWSAYRSTLYRFFDYYIHYELDYEIYNESFVREYEKIDMPVFNRFVKYLEKDGDVLSTQTLRNIHSHLYNMLYEMEKHQKIRVVGLGDSRKQNLSRYEETDLRKPYAELKPQDMETILNFLKTSKNPIRDTVIFLLTVSLGLERSQLLQLKWDDFDKEYKHIYMDVRKIELPEMLQKHLIELNQISQKAKIKSPLVLQKRQKNKYKPMDEWNINDVFNSFTKISKDKKWEMFSPQHVRNSLLLSLYSANYSIEDIMYITGIDINNISKYISKEELLKRRSKKLNWKSLYGGLLCDTVEN